MTEEEQQILFLQARADGLKFAECESAARVNPGEGRPLFNQARKRLEAKTDEHAIAIALRTGLIK